MEVPVYNPNILPIPTRPARRNHHIVWLLLGFVLIGWAEYYYASGLLTQVNNRNQAITTELTKQLQIKQKELTDLRAEIDKDKP